MKSELLRVYDFQSELLKSSGEKKQFCAPQALVLFTIANGWLCTLAVIKTKAASKTKKTRTETKMALTAIQIVSCCQLDEVRAHLGFGNIVKYAFLSGFLKNLP